MLCLVRISFFLVGVVMVACPLAADIEQDPESEEVPSSEIAEEFHCDLELAIPFVASSGQVRTSVSGSCSSPRYSVDYWVISPGLTGFYENGNVISRGSTGHFVYTNPADFDHTTHSYETTCVDGDWEATLDLFVYAPGQGFVDVIENYTMKPRVPISCPSVSMESAPLLQGANNDKLIQISGIHSKEASTPTSNVQVPRDSKFPHSTVVLYELNSKRFFGVNQTATSRTRFRTLLMTQLSFRQKITRPKTRFQYQHRWTT